MQTFVVIHFHQPSSGFLCDAHGKFGGGYRNAFAGTDAATAAIFASREMNRFGAHNQDGAILLAPKAVLQCVPQDLQKM